MAKLNDLEKVMRTKIKSSCFNGKIGAGVAAASKWLQKHKQTNNGKSFAKR
jgi:hypothetical protein